jgi:Xaa-Pro aminopeptidase
MEGKDLMTKQTGDISPKRISDQELQRRWQAVRQGMKERNLDFLIFQGNMASLPGYIRWFTDLSINDSYISTVVFPREDDMVTIWHGGRPPSEPRPPKNIVRGVKKRISVPIIQSLSYSTTFDAEKVVEELATFKGCRIGFVGMGIIAASFYKYVIEHLTNAKFEDATDLVDNIKAIKSEEEISFIRETCRLEDEIFEHVLTLVKPGCVDTKIRIDVINYCLQLGVVETNIMVNSGPPGVPTRPGPRVLENGDMFTILVETDSPTAYWGEMARTICLGKIAPEVQEQFEVAKEAQKMTVEMLKPGVSPKELFDANNGFLRKKGYAEETRIYAHGQGYDIVERPSLVAEDAMKIQNNMFFAIHPSATSAKGRMGICDNFLVKSGKNDRITKTPQKIFVV